MKIFVRYPKKLAKLNLAGVEASVRMNEAFHEFHGEVVFLEHNEMPKNVDLTHPAIWIEGLFPLLCSSILEETIRGLNHHESVAFFTQGRPELGITAIRSGNLIPKDVDFCQWNLNLKPHRLKRDPFHLFPLRGPKDFYSASQHFFQDKREELMSNGVFLMEPMTTWIETRVHIEPEVWVEPNVQVKGMTTIHAGARIGQGCIIENATIGAHALIKPHSIISDSWVGAHAQIGPFAHVRPGCHLGEFTKVGNFVEAKKTCMGTGSKASHLTYLGDTEMGKDCNIGAGTITCNYDGYNKSKTILGDRVFIGSDTQLIAPINLGDDSYVAAGSSISQDVPENALAISRARQTNKLGLAEKLREKARHKKESAKKGKS